MRILFCSRTGDGCWHAAVLAKTHDVDWVLGDDTYCDTLKGIIKPPIESISHPGDYDLIAFDDSSNGKVADELREHTPVIGSSELADTIEHDRLAGIEFMEAVDIKVPPYESFDDISPAIEWLKKQKRRAVFKPFGTATDAATTYVSKSSQDMIDYLEKLVTKVKVKEFLLQEFVEGTEISTEAWFNGEEFFALNHTLEEKKFMAGGVGPNTGCAGNVVWMPTRATAVFDRGLARAKRLLAEANFAGPIDLNTIVTSGELFGLEWTPRFGYEGTCNLMRLIPMDFGTFMHMIATGDSPGIAGPEHAFAASIRVTVPPYPNPSKPEKYEGVPIKGIDLDNLETFYLSDVRLNDDDELETIGTDGLIGAPIGVGESIKQAFAECETAIKRLQIPDLQWRNDVGDACARRYEALQRNGWLRSEEAVGA